MSNVLIVYGSTTGNTEWVASQLSTQIKEAGHTVETLNVTKAKASGLCSGRDLVLFGCSTWGQDEIELQDDFIPLYESLDKIGASGVKSGVFGCGDEDYTHFCGAVDAISGKLGDLGAKLVSGGLKINGDPSDSLESIKKWGDAVIASL
ncbi:MAG: flavodoxin [Deltaproteobacteria bacterium]|jgi:flavodoxin short chain|nr:flavodoxin [Deltaproteobacteria bacterium]